MSNIEEISEQLSAYLDGELSSEETRRVADMVAEDPALSDELESMREVRQLLRGLPHEQAPDGLLDTVLAGTQRKRTGWWVGRLARAAVIILAVGVGVTVTSLLNRPAERNGTQTPQHPQTPTFAQSGLTGIDRTAPEEVTNVRINTDNLILTQREVEKVFGRNSIEPVVSASELTRVTKAASGKHMGRGNFYNQTQVAPNQVRYELAITENQMRQVVAELNEIRARQIVSQYPVRHREGDNVIALAKVDFNDKSATGAARAAEYAKIRRAGEKKREEHGKHLADDGKHKVADSRPAYVEKPCPRRPTTTMPDPIVMKQQQRNIRSQKPLFNQATTTLATANIRQLVVILNVVAAN